MNAATIPPQNLVAERACLASQMLDSSSVDVVRQFVCVDDFYSDIHRILQRSIFRICDDGGELDTVTLAADLESSGNLAEIGGAAYLIEVLEAVPHSAHAASYARLVAESSRRRSAIAIGRELVKQAFDATASEASLMESAVTAALKLSELLSRVERQRPRPLSEHVLDAIEGYRTGGAPSLEWGLPEIDRMIGGVMPGEMIVIGARPSHGKSLLGLQWLDEASKKGIPGLMISEEMSAASLATRSLASFSDIPADEWHLRSGKLTHDSKQHFSRRAPVVIAEKCATVAAAERAIERAVRTHGVRIVAVDYVQLLSGEGETREQRVADVSMRMKAAAMRHDVVLLLLAQLNRSIESRDNPQPQLSDLRDSGGIENDADVAIFPFWPFKFDDTYGDSSEYRVYCRKNRNRGIREHVIKLRIVPERQRIEGIESEVPNDF